MLPSIGYSRILYSGCADRTSSADRKLGIIRAENFDGEPAGGVEVERPGAVESAGRLYLESIVLQSLIDLIDLLFALLREADVEGPRIFDLFAFHQGEEQPVIVGERGEGVAARGRAP